MLKNNIRNRCLAAIVLMVILPFMPTLLPDDYPVMLTTSTVPEYPEESLSWCGPASAQMIMDGYPSGKDFFDQDEIWLAVLDNKVETVWDTDPAGLRGAMQNLLPPPGFGSWVIHHRTDPEELMYWVAFWMNRNHYPVAALLSTVSHNGNLTHEEHWVVIRGFISNENPEDFTEIDILNVWYTDPSGENLGDPPGTYLVSGSDWYGMFQAVAKPASVYNGEYVAIIEPPSQLGRAIAPKKVLEGKLITVSDALKFADKWIKEYKLYDIEEYKDLKNAKPLQPLLVNKKYGGYYIIPYAPGGEDAARSAKVGNVRSALIVNAYNGKFQRVGAFKPVKYMTEQEAKQTALKYLDIKRADKIETELVTKIKGMTFGKYFPCWKITLDKKVVHISQGGKIFTDELPVFEPDKPRRRKWSASIHGGITFPVTDFGSRYKSSYMFGVNLDYSLSSKLSAVAFAGFNHFKVKPLFSYMGNTHWWNFSANLKWKLGSKPLRTYVNGGFGMYVPKSGTAKPGYNIGLGIDQPLSPHVTLEVGVDYHHILTNVEDPEFYAAHTGLIFRL